MLYHNYQSFPLLVSLFGEELDMYVLVLFPSDLIIIQRLVGNGLGWMRDFFRRKILSLYLSGRAKRVS